MKTCLVLTLACLTGVASAQTVATLSQSHQAASAALATRWDAEIDRLRQPYLAALATADQAATQSGNAETLRAIGQEREAVKAGKLRMEFPEALPRKLSPTRRALLTGEQRARLDLDKHQQAIDAWLRPGVRVHAPRPSGFPGAFGRSGMPPAGAVRLRGCFDSRRRT